MTTGHEILPHKLLSELHNDVESIKKKMVSPEAKAQELVLEIESLKESIHELTTIFQKALEEMKEDDISKTLATMQEKLDATLKQNETIARSMLVISDKVDELVQQKYSPSEMPHLSAPAMIVKHTMGMPAQMGRMGSRSEAPPLPDRGDMSVPLPPGKMADKKRSFGDIFT